MEALEALRKQAGASHGATLQCLNNLAVALSKLGAGDEPASPPHAVGFPSGWLR